MIALLLSMGVQPLMKSMRAHRLVRCDIRIKVHIENWNFFVNLMCRFDGTREDGFFSSKTKDQWSAKGSIS